MIALTLKELEAVFWAVSQHTSGCAYLIEEMVKEGLSPAGARALIRAEEKIRDALIPFEPDKGAK